jgi:hypothetical protein
MSIYPYTVSTDFSNGMDAEFLHLELAGAGVTGLLGVEDDAAENDSCEIEADASQQATIDAVVAAHDPEGLTTNQHKMYRTISLEVQTYLFAHYDANTQKSLTAMYDRAENTGKTNRAAHVGPALDWVLETVLSYFYGKKDAIYATTTQAELDAIAWDFDQFDASDPGVTIQSGLNITD